MMNITLLRGEWRRGPDRIHPATARTLHARGACRLWIPITPETADAFGWGPVATAREWHRLKAIRVADEERVNRWLLERSMARNHAPGEPN